jgi:hypothetical protein
MRAFARPSPAAFRVRQAQRFAPAFTRLASTQSAKKGKIHQVIGAVVDGKLPS